MNPVVAATAVAACAALAAGLAAPLASAVWQSAVIAAVLAGAAALAAAVLTARSLRAALRPLAEAAAAGARGETAALPRLPACLAGAADAAGELAEALRAARERAEAAEHQAEKWHTTNKLTAAGALKAKRRDDVTRQSMLEASATLREVSDSITAFAASLGTDAKKVSSGAEVQRGRVESAAAAVEEMNATNAEVARSASQASQIAERTRGMAGQGAGVVAESVNAIAELSGVMSGLHGDMADLGGKAASIGQVMTVISDIADQTNLLALNAAIEAARAGDAGRGFAVVADEVRKLAEKTMTATKEVEGVIRGIQDGTQKSLASMDQAARAVARATDLSGRSGGMLREILDLANGTSDQMQAIAAASSQQSAASEDVARNMETLARFSADTARDMTGAMESIHRLDGQIQELVKLSGVFRIISEGKVLAEVEQIAHGKEVASLTRDRAEPAMRHAVDRHPFLELLYLTDGAGIQITENIAPKDFRAAYADSARGKNWSGRPWFAGAVKNKDTFLSSIYVSEASGDYCLTVSVPIMQGDAVVGVLGADIKLFG